MGLWPLVILAAHRACEVVSGRNRLRGSGGAGALRPQRRWGKARQGPNPERGAMHQANPRTQRTVVSFFRRTTSVLHRRRKKRLGASTGRRCWGRGAPAPQGHRARVRGAAALPNVSASARTPLPERVGNACASLTLARMLYASFPFATSKPHKQCP